MKFRDAWVYLRRALDKEGNTIDFNLFPTRHAKAEKRFLGKALTGLNDLGKAGNHQHRQEADLRHRDLGTEGRRQMSGGNSASISRVSKQCHRGRSWQVRAIDPSNAWFYDDEDSLRDHQRIWGNARSTQEPGGSIPLHPRHPRRDTHG